MTADVSPRPESVAVVVDRSSEHGDLLGLLLLFTGPLIVFATAFLLAR